MNELKKIGPAARGQTVTKLPGTDSVKRLSLDQGSQPQVQGPIPVHRSFVAGLQWDTMKIYFFLMVIYFI